MQPFLIITLSLLVGSPVGVYSLQCLCNVCENEENSCNLTHNRDSMCFMSVTRDKEPDGTFQDVKTYGCFSAGDSLHFMQCRAASFRHHKPTYIKCCNDYDFCNENFTDPTKEDDPRWGKDPAIYDYGGLLLILLLCTFLMAIIILLVEMAQQKAKRITTKKPDPPPVSISDFEHFIESAPQACSSLSTQSYLTSEGSCPKRSPDEVSLSYGSGVGPKFLTERTFAITVSKGIRAQVGEGRFGRVIVGRYHDEDVAVKCFKMCDEDSWQREDIIFRWLSHDNIVRHISSELMVIKDTIGTEIWMFLEYCPDGSLCDFLDRQQVADPVQAVNILYSIINGLNYLHENFAQRSGLRYKPSIAHRDLKSKNILMKTHDTCCLADFGHSLVRIDENRLDKGKYRELHVGTIRYMAPEILQWNEKMDYSHFYTYAQADLYQFGLVLWEVCNRTNLDSLHYAGQHLLPYDNVVPQDPSIADMIKIVCEDNYRPERRRVWDGDQIMRDLSAMMPECWRSNPAARMETLGVKKRLKDLYLGHASSRYNLAQIRTDHTFGVSKDAKSDQDRANSGSTTMVLSENTV